MQEGSVMVAIFVNPTTCCMDLKKKMSEMLKNVSDSSKDICWRLR